jgi:MHS family proline/betaine transporter-like MFS transporter
MTLGLFPALTPKQRRAIAAATIGSVLEYYDFAVYGFLSIYIAKAFFPAQSTFTSLLLTVATFGVGFVMRPVGAIVLGGYADRAGRKAGLTVTISIMALGTALIGVTPSFATLGALAPAILVLGRLLQGFSAGGEFGSATALLVEHAPEGRRATVGSLQQLSQGISLLLGSLVSAAVAALLNDSSMAEWGWRVPFLLGLLILPVGLYLRTNVEDSESFTQRVATQQPIRDAITGYGRLVAIGFGVTIAWTVCTYCLLIFMPTYAIRELGFPAAQALTSNGLGIVAVVVFALIGGALSDRVGLRWPMAVGALAIAASVYFLFASLAANPSLPRLIVVQVLLGAMVGLYTGPAPTLVATMFPVEVRSSGFSLAYNFAVTIFGGFAPFISTWLVGLTGSKLAVTFYVLAAVLVSLVSLACLGIGSKAGM